MRWFLAAAFVLCSQYVALADRPPDYLEVSNRSGQTQWVYLWARGGANPDKTWQPGNTIINGRSQRIRLRNFEPFDVLVLAEDGTFTRVDAVNLCSMIDNCRTSGVKSALLSAQKGTWRRDKDGRFVLDEKINYFELPAGADYDTVSIEVPRPRRKK